MIPLTWILMCTLNKTGLSKFLIRLVLASFYTLKGTETLFCWQTSSSTLIYFLIYIIIWVIIFLVLMVCKQATI